MIDLASNSDGDIYLGIDQDIALVAGADETGQAGKIALLAYKGEYRLDLEFGLDYENKINAKNANITDAQRAIYDTLAQVQGVRNIGPVGIDQSTTNERHLSAQIRIETEEGIVTINT